MISKKEYGSWREIQNEYYDKYITSLAPMTYEQIIEFFKDDFGEESNWPFAELDIIRFFNSTDTVICSEYN